MKYFILEQIFFLSIGIITYIIIRKLPQVRGFEDKKLNNVIVGKKGLLMVWDNLAGVLDQKMVNFIEKLLRKVKILLMKMDNYASHHLKKISPRGGEDDGELSSGIFDDKDDDIFGGEENN